MAQPASSGLPRPVWQTILFILVVALLLWFLIQAGHVVVLVLFALVLAAALYPPVAWLRRRHFPSTLSILGFYLLFIVLFGGMAFLALNALFSEGRQFVAQLPVYNQRIAVWLEALPEPLGSLSVVFSRQVSGLAASALNLLISSLSYLFSLASGVVGILTVLVLTFYLLVYLDHFKRLVMLLVPAPRQETTERILVQTAAKIGGWVRGQLLLMAVVGSLVWLGMSVLGVRYAFMLGALSFMLEVVPLIGPLVAMGVGVLIALAQEPMLALWVALYYLGVQQVENFALVPRIMSQAVALNPFWVLLSVLCGVTVAGISGALLAIPAAVLVHVLVDELYIRGVLGRNSKGDTPA